MAMVSVSQVKPGDKLADPVLTRRGNLLLEKGQIITLREKDILQAFFIPSVSVEAKGEAKKDSPVTEEPSAAPVPFFDEMKTMRAFLKKVFSLAQAGQPLPILDIRTNLERLYRQIDQYQVLGAALIKSNESDYLLDKSILVSMTSYQLAKWSNYPQKDWMPIGLAGLFYDIGNVKIDPAIFEKKTPLNDLEKEEMKKHPVYGYQLLKNVPAINEGVKLCALQHHEKEDGTGYPLGVKGEKIHPYAKIVAIADIFHAMTSNRTYKTASSPYIVLEQLFEESFGKLDHGLVNTFIQRATSFHNGTVVRLNDDRIGEIVFSDRAHPTRPWVNVGGQIVNLTLERQLHIQEVLTDIY